MSDIITVFFISVLVTLLYVWEAVGLETNRTSTFIISSRKNQTGHSVTQASLSHEGSEIPKHWKVKVQQAISEYAGIQSFQLTGSAIVPPQIPDYYRLFPGVGYYKFHSNFSNGFDDASSKCAMEGGHLAIVNSEAEHQVLKTLFAEYPESELKAGFAFVGFHDRNKEGEYVTIFGEPLKTTGFTRWSASNEPNDYNKAEDCGSVHRNGGLNDITCGSKLPFICEYDLSWADLT